MALIDNEEAARRLARVIISDIELYEKKKIQAGDDLTAPMAEGRALFHRRVVPALAAIFEAVVEAKRSGASTGGPTVLTPPPIGMPPRPTAGAAPPAPGPSAAATAQPDVDAAAATTALDEPEVVRTRGPAEAVAERVEVMGPAGEADGPLAHVTGTWAADADAGEARLDDARPLDTVLSEPTARTDLTAEAAATRNPDPTARTPAREAWKDDRITPVQVEDVVTRRSETTEAPATAWAARAPDAPRHEASQDERVTSPVAFAAMTSTPPEEPPPLGARPAAHTPVPLRAAAVAPPAVSLAATPPSLGLTKMSTPQPSVSRREPPPIPRDPGDKTPVPMSVSLTAAPPSVRPPASPPHVASPLAASPFAGLATIPPDALAPPARSEDVVNLRAKTSKVRVLFYIVATAGGLALIGRFLTRFL